MNSPFFPAATVQHRFDVAGKSVFIGMPTHRDFPAEMMVSMFRTMNACREVGIDLTIHEEIGSSLIEAARSKVAYHFLQGSYDMLFWIDSDIVWDPNDFVRLVALCTQRDIVAACYPAKMLPMQFMINGNPGDRIDTDELGLISQIKGIGMGFTCVSRRVIEAMVAGTKENPVPMLVFPDVGKAPIPKIFRTGATEEGHFMGEDMAFFHDCRELGFPLYIDPTVKLGHVGPHKFEGRLSDLLEKVGPVLGAKAATSDAA